MAALQNAVCPTSLALQLRTLTPLYTGGIAMNGEQIHPAGLLGGIRRFSCLVAHALGDDHLERRVWGQVDGPQEQHHAKRIGLHFDLGGLTSHQLPSPITLGPRPHRGWFFGQAQTGTLGLRLIRPLVHNLADADWKLLTLALRIQIQHATFGAKDQFGLGVLEAYPEPLSSTEPLTTARPPTPIGLGLHQAFFAKLRFPCPAPADMKARMLAGLAWRRHLRNCLRGPWPGLTAAEMTLLRHYTLGYLRGNQGYGSAVNVSAVYPLSGEGSGIRIWGLLPHTQPEPTFLTLPLRNQILGNLRAALAPGGGGPARQCANWTLDWQEWNPGVHPNITDWLNLIAGVS